MAFIAASPSLVMADIVASDDFSSYADGSAIAGPDWNVKWQGGSDQQNLMTANGGVAFLDTATANSNYHMVQQTGFTLNAGDTASITTDFTYTHNGLGAPVAFNQSMFGILLRGDNTGAGAGNLWWQGNNQNVTSVSMNIANRGAAIGNTLPVAPWIENWNPHGDNGVNINAGYTDVDGDGLYTTGVDTLTGLTSTSSVISVSMDLSINAAGNHEAVLNYGGFTSTAVDTGLIAGNQVFTGFTNAWVGAAPNTTLSQTNIQQISMDNFVVDVTAVPEPSSLILLSLVGFAGLVRRVR